MRPVPRPAARRRIVRQRRLLVFLPCDVFEGREWVRLPESAMLHGLRVQLSTRLLLLVLLRQVPHRPREVRREAVLGILY